MVIKSSGEISLLDLRTEFIGGSSQISLGDLYRNNANMYTRGVDGIVASGSTITIGDFYAKAKVANYTNLVLFIDAKNTLSYTGSGTSWNDLSSKANNLTIYNGSFYNTAGGTIYFNGSSTYVYKSSFTGWNSSNWTAICWIYTLGNYGGAILQLGRSSTDADTEIVWYLNYMWDYNSGYGFQNYASSYPNSKGWYQVAFVKNTTSCYWYLNGTSTGSGSASLNAVYSANDFCIGKDYRDNNSFLYGYVSMIMVYNYSMTASEISTNFTNYRGRYGI